MFYVEDKAPDRVDKGLTFEVYKWLKQWEVRCGYTEFDTATRADLANYLGEQLRISLKEAQVG